MQLRLFFFVGSSASLDDLRSGTHLTDSPALVPKNEGRFIVIKVLEQSIHCVCLPRIAASIKCV